MKRLTKVAGVLILATIAMFAYGGYRRAVATSALHEAVYNADSQEVTRLLAEFHHVDQRNRGDALGIGIRRYPLPYENDVTPLYVAVAELNPKLVHLLLRSGANPNLEFAGYDTVLHRAIGNLSPPVNIHGYDLSDEPPFDRAAAIEVIRLLVTNGADINRRCSRHGETPIEMCDRLGEKEITKNMVAWQSARLGSLNVPRASP